MKMQIGQIKALANRIYDELYDDKLKVYKEKKYQHNKEKTGIRARFQKLVTKLESLDQEMIRLLLMHSNTLEHATKNAFNKILVEDIGVGPMRPTNWSRSNESEYAKILDDVQLAMLDAKDVEELMDNLLKKYRDEE